MPNYLVPSFRATLALRAAKVRFVTSKIHICFIVDVIEPHMHHLLAMGTPCRSMGPGLSMP